MTAPDDPPFSAEETGAPRIRLGTVVFIISSLLAAGWLWQSRRPADPTAVMIAVSGCSEACRQNIAMSAAFVLETQGFTVVDRHGESASDPSALFAKTLDSLVAHAFFVTVDEASAERVGDSWLVPIRIDVRSGGQDLTSEITIAIEDRPSETDSEDVQRDRALMEAALAGLDALAPDSVGSLLLSDVVGDYVDRAPANSATAVAQNARVSESRREANSRLHVVRSLEEECQLSTYDMPQDEELSMTCVTTGCDQEHLLGLSADALFVQSEGLTPVVPFGSVGDVLTAPSPESIRLVQMDRIRRGRAPHEDLGMITDETTMVRARNLYGYSSTDGQSVSFISVTEGGFTLFVRDAPESPPRLLVTARRPAVLSNARAFGEWILFERKAFPDSDPVLHAIRKSGGRPIEVLPFAAQGAFVHVSLGGRRETLVAAFVPGIEESGNAALEETALEAQAVQETEAGLPNTPPAPDGESPEGVDDLEEMDVITRARLSAGLPARDHIALVRLPQNDQTEAELVMRLGGRSFPLSYAQATPSGALVLIRVHAQGPAACSLMRLGPARLASLASLALDGGASLPDDLETGEDKDEQSADGESGESSPWQRMEICPSFPVVSENAIYGTAIITDEGDPSSTDTEVVRVSQRDGSVVQLTLNDIDERFVRLSPMDRSGRGSTRVGFERLREQVYARFRPVGVCTFIDPP